MKKIDKFELIDDLGSYDKKNNPSELSVFELLPIGISWHYNGIRHEKLSDDKVIAILTKDQTEIALIEAPFNKHNNQAYILYPDGNVKWNIGEIIRKENRSIIISDVYYIYDELYFFINTNGNDFRFAFDTSTGTPGKLIKSY